MGLIAAMISPPAFPTGAARGTGQPVIVLPGFCSPNFTTARLREFLKRQGFNSYSWGCGTNLGPTASDLAKFERSVSAVADRHRRPVCLVGVSLGGTMAREFAKRRLDCVARVITLCSPIKYPVATPLAPIAQAAISVWDERYIQNLIRLNEPPPVPLTAIVSTRDGILDWRVTLPEPAPNVEVIPIDTFHLTSAFNPEIQRIIADRAAND
jgi:pimeloyl-ACP methyl ester carboxylesterase